MIIAGSSGRQQNSRFEKEPYKFLPAGHTLIELGIVIVLLGIIATAAAINLTGVSDIRIHLAAQQLRSDLRYAQQLSMDTSQHILFQFNRNLPPHGYQIFRTGALDIPAVPLQDPHTQKDFNIEFSPDVRITGMSIPGGSSQLFGYSAGIETLGSRQQGDPKYYLWNGNQYQQSDIPAGSFFWIELNNKVNLTVIPVTGWIEIVG